MTPYPRISSFSIDPVRFSAMIEEFRAYSETEEKKMPSEKQESRLHPWIDDESYDVLNTEWEDFYREPSEYDEGQEWDVEDGDWDDDDDWDDGQPSEYDEWQDVYGGDDWDHGQFDY